MGLTQVFRAFLISDMLLTAASILAGFETTATTDEQSSDSLLYILVVLAVLLAWIIALAGLWSFRNWARILYLAVAVVGLVGTLIPGGEELGSLEDSLNALCWLVTGVIIALMYWSPVAFNFRARERAA